MSSLLERAKQRQAELDGVNNKPSGSLSLLERAKQRQAELDGVNNKPSGSLSLLERAKQRQAELNKQRQTPKPTNPFELAWDKIKAFVARGKYEAPQFKSKRSEGLLANVSQFDITVEDVKNNPNLLPLYRDINKTTTVLPGPRRKGKGGVSDIPKDEEYTTSLDPRKLGKREGLKAQEEVKKDRGAELLPTAPLTTKVARSAQDTITDLRHIDAEFKSTKGVINRYNLIDKKVVQPFMQGASQSFSRYVSQIAETGEVILDFATPWIKNKADRERRYNAINNAITNIYPSEEDQNLFYKIGSFVPELAMYVTADHGITKLFGQLPRALRSQKLIQELAEASSWIGVGQVIHREDQGSRGVQALYDGISYGLFRGVLGIRAVTNNVFNDALGGVSNNIKKKLPQTAQDIVTKIDEGQPVLVDEVEYAIKELANADTPGGVQWRGIDIETNSQQRLDNLIPNMGKVNYEIDPNAAKATIQFPTSSSQAKKGIRVIARNEDELAELSRAIGGDLTNKVERLAQDVLSGVFKGDWDNIKQEALSALVSNAVRDGALTVKAINESVEKFLGKFIDLARNAAEELPPTLKKRAPIGGFDDNPSDYMELIAEAIVKTDTYKSASFRKNNLELTRFFESLGDIKPSAVTKIADEDIPSIKQIPKPTKAVKATEESKAAMPTAVKTKEIEVQLPRSSTPVGKGEIKASRNFQRMKEDYKIDLGELEYKRMNMDEQISDAIKYVNEDYNRALEVSRGLKETPKGLLYNTISEATALEALRRGDISTFIELSARKSYQATRMGQEIRALADEVRDQNNPVNAIRELTKARIEAAGGLDNIKIMVNRQVKKMKEELRRVAPKKDEWSKFLEEIKC